jgi:hypothetical protein
MPETLARSIIIQPVKQSRHTGVHMKIKKTLPVMACAAITSLAAGCKPASVPSSRTTAEELAKVKAEARRTNPEIKDRKLNQRTRFAANMHSELDEFHRSFGIPGAKIEKGGDAAKAEARIKLEDLREESRLAAEELDQTKSMTENCDFAAAVLYGRRLRCSSEWLPKSATSRWPGRNVCLRESWSDLSPNCIPLRQGFGGQALLAFRHAHHRACNLALELFLKHVPKDNFNQAHPWASDKIVS